jgi:hypothetical protein
VPRIGQNAESSNLGGSAIVSHARHRPANHRYSHQLITVTQPQTHNATLRWFVMAVVL